MSSHDFLERRDVIEIGNQVIADLIARPPTQSEVPLTSLMVTSGTSGGLLLVMAWDRLPGELGPMRSKRVVVAFGSLSTRLDITLRALKDGPVSRVIAADSRDLGSELFALMEDFRPECFYGYTVFTQRIAEYMSAEAATRVKYAYIGGGKLTPELATALRERLPSAAIRQFYGANEIGTLAAQPCPSLRANQYHPIPRVAIDIVEPDENGIGSIVVSKKFARGRSVTDYYIGDFGAWCKTRCECGRLAFEVIGREGLDRVKIAGALLLREEFDRVAERCRDLFEDYRTDASERIVAGRVKGRVVLRVRTAGRSSEALRTEIQRRVSNDLRLTRTRTLAELVATGDFLPLVVEFASEPFVRANKEIKVRMSNG